MYNNKYLYSAFFKVTQMYACFLSNFSAEKLLSNYPVSKGLIKRRIALVKISIQSFVQPWKHFIKCVKLVSIMLTSSFALVNS